jgi:hypothetical protein
MGHLSSSTFFSHGKETADATAEVPHMMILWGYLGWSIVAVTAFAYLLLVFRVVLFPKHKESAAPRTPRLAA